jgi:hypothetical protein
MDLIPQIIIALNKLNVFLSFLCFLRAPISRKMNPHIYSGAMIYKRKCLEPTSYKSQKFPTSILNYP